MTISQTLTPPTTAPSRTQDKDTFNTNVDNRLAWQGTNVTELAAWQAQANALAASMNSVAAGTATSIPYTFSTTTTDADPGNGILRLDNATQNIATTIRADLVGSEGSTWTSLLDIFDDSTSTTKGFIMLMKSGDATKWLLFSVSALASPAGYKNITVANVASSAVSPFADGDSLILKFTRNGDKGDTGPIAVAVNHGVVVTNGNGHGSTNNKVRRYTTTQSSVGTSITYADSAANGASFTINDTGIYAIYSVDVLSASNTVHGASVNSSELTTGINGITAADRILTVQTPAAGFSATGSCVVRLTATDVVRPHGDGTADGTLALNSVFAIRRIV